MAQNKYLNSVIQIAISFFFGFIFVFFIVMIGSGVIVGKNVSENIQESRTFKALKLTTYEGPNYSISYPENYQFSEGKIIGTEGIVTDQENTIHLISPTLINSDGNLSLIITHEPLKEYEEEKNESTTCPELYDKKLDPIKVGKYTFTHSGLINCGPNEVAFFYVVNNYNVYEVKVETTADYESEAYPEVLKILKTIKFKEE